MKNTTDLKSKIAPKLQIDSGVNTGSGLKIDSNIFSTDLFDAITTINNNQEAKNFFADLCTPAEIKALKERWKVCQLLHHTDLSYRQIHQITGASLTTIGRVARFLKDENYGGYKQLLNKTKNINNTY